MPVILLVNQLNFKKEENMEKLEEFFSAKVLSRICAILQIIGFLLIIFKVVAPVIIRISGFAAIVKFFLPIPENRTLFGFVTALVGLGIIIAYHANM